jgi:putative membrane protein
MINYLLRFVVSGIALWVLQEYVQDIRIASIPSGIFVAVVMSLLNTFLKPILKFITLPINFLTLGLFSLVITIALIYLCDYLIEGFEISGVIAPLIMSVVLYLSNWAVSVFKSKD